jgi:rod shape-determining protein MreC
MERKKIFKIIFLILAVLLVLFSINEFFYKSFKNIVFSVSSPFQKFFWSLSNTSNDIFESIFNLKNIKIENTELKKENLFLKGELLKLKKIREENNQLRRALDIGLGNEFSLIYAEVISKKPTEDSLLISKGRQDGVKNGIAVVSEEKILIGRINEVFDNFSEVRLISHKDFTFSIEIEIKEDKKISAISKGKGNFNIDIELLPKEVEFKRGNLVLTNGLGGIFPENLLVGEIASFKKAGLQPFSQAKLLPYFKTLNLEKLFLIEPKK